MSAAWKALETRLAKMERKGAAETRDPEADRRICSVLTVAIAIGLGNYPRPSEQPYGFRDSYGDAFARALGYPNRDVMDAADLAVADGWAPRIERALTALCEINGRDRAPITAGQLIRACAAVFAANPVAASDRIRVDLATWAATSGVTLP